MVSTSASDLGGPISISRDSLLRVPPRPNLADYAPILLPAGDAIVWTDENRPVPAHGLAGQGLDFVVTRALSEVLKAEPTGQAVEGLRRAFLELYNGAPKGAQIAVLTAVGIGSLGYAVSNLDSIIASLGNSTFSIDVPVELLGIRGVKLSLQIALNQFNPSVSAIVLQLSQVFGGTLTATASIPTRTVNLGWVLAENLVPGLNLAIQVNGIGSATPSAGVQVQLSF